MGSESLALVARLSSAETVTALAMLERQEIIRREEGRVHFSVELMRRFLARSPG